jgi:hypothetical protein
LPLIAVVTFITPLRRKSKANLRAITPVRKSCEFGGRAPFFIGPTKRLPQYIRIARAAAATPGSISVPMNRRLSALQATANGTPADKRINDQIAGFADSFNQVLDLICCLAPFVVLLVL